MRFAEFLRLDAVIDRVAKQMNQRVVNHSHDLLVELRVSSLDFELHLFAAGRGQLTQQNRQSVPRVADRFPVQLPQSVAHLRPDEIEPSKREIEFPGFLGLAEFLNLLLHDRQLVGQSSQLLDQQGVEILCARCRRSRRGHGLQMPLVDVVRPTIATLFDDWLSRHRCGIAEHV